MADIVYSSSLDDKQVLAALQRIDKNIDKIAGDGKTAFDSVEQSAKASGVQIGAMSGIVQEVTRRFIDLGAQALKVFVDIAKSSVEVGLELDKLKNQLPAIFGGSKEAADEAFNYIQKEQKRLGTNLEDLAVVFLPKVENLEQFSKLAELSTAIERTPGVRKGAGVLSLTEALTGQFESLRRLGNIARSDVKGIKAAFEEAGIKGLIEELDNVLTRTGRSFDATKNSAQVSISKIHESLTQLQGQLSLPIVDELKKQFDTLFGVLDGKESDLRLIADTFGRVGAQIVEIIGSGLTDFFQNLDTDQVVEIGEKFFDIVEDARLLGEQLGLAEFPQGLIDGVDSFASGLDSALTTLNQITLLTQAEIARQNAKSKSAVGINAKELEEQLRAGKLSFVDYLKGVAEISASVLGFTDTTEAAAAGQKAYDDTIKNGLAAFEASRKAKEENRKATEDSKNAIDEAANSATSEANAYLLAADAARKLSDAQEAATEAQNKINEALDKANTDLQRNLEDIDIATERKRLDIAIDFAQKREDAARKNLQKIADLEQKNQDDIADVELDRTRKSEDIARNYWRDRADLERDQRQKFLDIEIDYRKKLEDIQSQFLLDADEAEKKRDAVGFLKAIKDRDKKVQDAQKDRQREIEDAQKTGEEKRQALLIGIQREAEDADIAQKRKLEDLQTNLERQIEAQNTAYARELENLAISEAEKNDELERNRQRDIEDAQRAYDRKLEDLQKSLEAEFALIQEYNALLEQEAARHAEAMAALEVPRGSAGGAAPGLSGGGGKGAGGGNIPLVPQQDIPGFQHGGQFVVPGSGGTDSQLVQFRATPGEKVNITPASMRIRDSAAGGGVSNVNNSRNVSMAIPPDKLSPGQRSEIRQIAFEVLGGIL